MGSTSFVSYRKSEITFPGSTLPLTIEVPQFSRRSVKTCILVANGGTILLAGMDPPESEKKGQPDQLRTMLVLLSASAE